MKERVGGSIISVAVRSGGFQGLPGVFGRAGCGTSELQYRLHRDDSSVDFRA